MVALVQRPVSSNPGEHVVVHGVQRVESKVALKYVLAQDAHCEFIVPFEVLNERVNKSILTPTIRL